MKSNITVICECFGAIYVFCDIYPTDVHVVFVFRRIQTLNIVPMLIILKFFNCLLAIYIV